MEQLPEMYLDVLSQMVVDLGPLGEEPEFAPLLSVIRRGLVMMRNPDDFELANFEEFYRELLTTAHAIPGMEMMAEALASLVGMDLNDS